MCSGVPGWDALWSLSSLHKEWNSYSQAAPTHLQCHQWHQMPLEEEEGAMVAVFARKHKATCSIPVLPKEEQHGVVPACRKFWIPRCSMSADSLCGSFHLPSKSSADMGVTFPGISSCSHNPHSVLFKGLNFPRTCSQPAQSCGGTARVPPCK